MRNPFTELQADCGDFTLPVIPVNQDCTIYDQKLSEVSAIIVLPDGAAAPVDWSTITGWSGVIDNTDASKAKYIVGIGSYLPNQSNVSVLAGGRGQSEREKSYTLNFRVLNMDAGHLLFGRQIEKGYNEFSVWLETISGRLIGGKIGMSPQYVGCTFPFGEGKSREYMQLSMTFFFECFPDSVIIGSLNPNPTGQNFWGTPGTDIWGNGSEGWGWE